jgi:CHAD domain-containing protein
MAYRLKAGRPLTKSILRAGLEQIELSTNGVHQARKAFKRMRALLLLIRPIIGEKAYARENQRYRALGQRFSGVRDIQALLDTVRKVEARYDLSGRCNASAAIADWLREERRRAEQALSSEHKNSGLKALAEAQKSFGRLPMERATLGRVVRGLQDGYRKGRGCFARAYATGEDEDFHDWRKAMQRHWRHLQLVSPAWPEALQPRIALAQELSQILGDDHDLAVLCDRVARHCGSFLQNDEIAGFIEHCRNRQSELRRLAKGRGARLLRITGVLRRKSIRWWT